MRKGEIWRWVVAGREAGLMSVAGMGLAVAKFVWIIRYMLREMRRETALVSSRH